MTDHITYQQARYLTSLLQRNELRDLPPVPIGALTRRDASEWLTYLARRVSTPPGPAPPAGTMQMGEVLHADALQFLASVERVDVVVTDPPYPNRSTLFPDDQLTGLAALYVACTRARKVIFCWNPACVPDAPPGWCEVARHVWEKPNAPGREEVIVVWERGKGPARHGLVLQIPAITSRSDPEWVAHPTQKPIALLQAIIEHETHVDDVILDPFLGSGTTALACENLRRSWAACEHHPGYVALARQRLAAMQSRVTRQDVQHDQRVPATGQPTPYFLTPPRDRAPEGYRPPYQLVPEAADHEHALDSYRTADDHDIVYCTRCNGE